MGGSGQLTKISITLPSLFPEDLARALDAIQANTRSADYEVIVVSPFEVSRPRVKWVREEEARGNCHAHRAAFAHASGEFVLAFTDDAVLLPGWDEQALAGFTRRAGNSSAFCLGLLTHTRVVCTVFGIYYANFPFARRADLVRLGYFSDAYRAHFGDVDLSLRVWEAGGRCEFSERPLVTAGPEEGPQRDAGKTHRFVAWQRDEETFLARWRQTYGKGWDTSHRDRFLLDLNAPTQLTVVNGNSVFINNPRFRELYENFNANIAQVRVAMAFPE